MRRAFEDYGEVTLHIAKVLLTGGAGSGKTCTKAILYGRVPPTDHISTDLLEGEKPTYCEKLFLPTGEVFEKWTAAELKDILVMLRNGIMSRIESNSRQETMSRGQHTMDIDGDHVDANDSSNLGPTGQLLQEIKEQGFGGRNIADFYWVYFFDSAGQSEYLDIIPAFIKNVTVTVYVLDLTKPLHLKLKDNLGDSTGQPVGRQDNFTVKGEQMLQVVLQTLQFQGESKLMVVGTHRDKCNDQMIKDRNDEIHEIIDRPKRQRQQFEVLPNGKYDEHDIIFQLSAIPNPNPDQDRTKKTATDIRKEISTKCSKKKPIPITWFLCEEDLRNKGDILTFEEYEPVASQYGMDERELYKMLKLFHELNIFFYYPEDDKLKNIVFTNPLIVMKIVSKVVKRIRESNYSDMLTPRKTVTKRCLDEMTEQRTQLIKLLEKRLILVQLQSTTLNEYYMPCVFPVCENPNEAIENKRQANEKLHTSFFIEFEDGCAPRGTFHGLVCYFLRELLSNVSDCYRNLIHGDYKRNSTFQVSLVNSFQYFEVHVIGPNYDDSESICGNIRSYLKDGMKEVCGVIHTDLIKYEERFICPATKDCCSGSRHMAEIPKDGKRMLICLRNKSTYKFDQKHLVWLDEEERRDVCGK